MPEETPRKCPSCQTEIPTGFPDQFCPRCLLESPEDREESGEGSPASDIDSLKGAETVPSPHIPPKRINKYVPTTEELSELFPDIEIIGPLGAGGMGVVFRARQPRLDRIVALKVLSCPPDVQENFALRFEREAQLLAKLNHPNIVTIFDFGEIERSEKEGGNLFYFLMEYVDGSDLNKLIRSSLLKPEQALQIVPAICDALQFAHDKGITHRDIKPANILVDKDGQVKIADFGLAKLVQGDESMMTNLTMTGSAMGTPHYMAPEQWDAPEKVDHRADIYSLGVVFYEMLTGERPAGIFDPPSRKTQVDIRIDDIVLRAIEKELDKRYQKVSEVKEDVSEVTSEPVPDRRREKKKGGGKLVACLAVMVLLSAAIAWSLWKWQPEEGSGKGVGENNEKTPSIPPTPPSDPEPVFLPENEEGRTSKLFARAEPGVLRAWTKSSEGEIDLDLTHAEGIDDFVQVGIRDEGGRNHDWYGLRKDGTLISGKSGIIAKQVRAIVPGNNYSEKAEVYITKTGELVSLNPFVKQPQLGSLQNFTDLALSSFGTEDREKGSFYHALILWEDGRTEYRVLGSVSEKKYEESWRQPPPEAATGVVEVSMNAYAALARKKDGSYICWSKSGSFPLPNDTVSAVLQLGAVRRLTTSGKLLATQNLPNSPYDGSWKENQVEGTTSSLLATLNYTLYSLDDGGWKLETPIYDRLKGLGWNDFGDFIEPLKGHSKESFAFRLFSSDTETNSSFYSILLVIEPPGDTSSGLLKAVGTKPNHEPVDTSRAAEHSDLVSVAGRGGAWVALRSNGDTVSADGKADFSNIDKLCWSYAQRVALIDKNGMLKFPEWMNETPPTFDDQRIIDAKIGLGHGIALTADKRALVFGPRHEAEFDHGDSSYNSPKWPTIPQDALTDVKDIAVSQTHAATLREDGTLSVFAWEGTIDLPQPNDLERIIDIASGEDELWMLDVKGQVWRLGLQRSPGANPVGHAGKMLKVTSGAEALAHESWRDSEGQWHSNNQELNRLLQENEIRGDTSFVMGEGTSSGEKFSALFWIDSNHQGVSVGSDTIDATFQGPGNRLPMQLEVPPALAAMRKRGGRLRSWTNKSEDPPGLKLAEGIDDFVRLDGLPFPKSDRWLAVRASGSAVTPLKDFERSSELISLNTHMGNLRSGEVLDCWQDNRKLNEGNAAFTEAAGGPGGSRIILHKDGTLSVLDSSSHRSWDNFPELSKVISDVDDAVQVSAQYSAAAVLRANGEVISWTNDHGLINPEPPIKNAVEIDTDGDGFFIALIADGSVRVWNKPGAKEKTPPEDLGKAYAVRCEGWVYAAQMADGTWRAWEEKNSGKADQINSMGPAVDILLPPSHNAAMLWIEPADSSTSDSSEKVRLKQQLEIPPALAAMRKRGGYLRSWANESEIPLGLDLAKGIDDFVRLDGLLFPGSDRWLAVRVSGTAVTPLEDFDRSAELVSLNRHLGTLRTGEVLHCWEDQRRVTEGNAIFTDVAGKMVRMILNKDGTLTVLNSGSDDPWEKIPEISSVLSRLNDVVQISAENQAAVVLRANGEIVSWTSDHGLITPDMPIKNAVEVACNGGGYFIALLADGSVRLWNKPGGNEKSVPEDLEKAYAVRCFDQVYAAQMADGTWRAWGGDRTGKVDQINSMGPAVDILISSVQHELMLWIEPADSSTSNSNDNGSLKQQLEVPPALAAMRRRGGNLRSWANESELPPGLDLAKGVDDFVRLDGVLYPGSDRWLAVRASGTAVSPLKDFDRTEELTSLNTHMGILQSGEILHCWKDNRRIQDGDAIFSDVAGTPSGARIILNKDGTLTLLNSGADTPWDKLPTVQAALSGVSDVVQVSAVHGVAAVLRANGEVISWTNDLGLITPDPPIKNAIEIDTDGGGFFIALIAGGSVRIWNKPGVVTEDKVVPEDLGKAYAVRCEGWVFAAQMADGRWRAWGENWSGKVDKINSMGPAVDLLLPPSQHDTMLWIEPD